MVYEYNQEKEMYYATERYIIIRKPDSEGTVVYKKELTGKAPLSKAIVKYSEFVLEAVADKSTLESIETDDSVLNEEEVELLGL